MLPFFWNDSWTNISYLGVAIAWSEIVNRLWSKWTSGTTRVKHIVLYNLKVVSSIPEVEWFQHKLGSLILPFKFYSHCVQLVPLKQPPGIRNWWPSTTILICLVRNWHTKNIPDDPSLPSPADKFLWIGREKKAEALSGRTLKNYDRKETLKIRSFFFLSTCLVGWPSSHQKHWLTAPWSSLSSGTRMSCPSMVGLRDEQRAYYNIHFLSLPKGRALYNDKNELLIGNAVLLMSGIGHIREYGLFSTLMAARGRTDRTKACPSGLCGDWTLVKWSSEADFCLAGSQQIRARNV